MWCWHRWSKWVTLREGPLRVREGTRIVEEYYYMEQKRICSKCGKVELREVKSK